VISTKNRTNTCNLFSN